MCSVRLSAHAVYCKLIFVKSEVIWQGRTHFVVESSLSTAVQRTGNMLRESASSQIIEYNRRFDSIKGLYDTFLADLITSDFNQSKALQTALEFFGSEKAEFAAIDGTEYTSALFDMIIFFGGAYAAKGTVAFKKDKAPQVEYATRFAEEGRGLSSCISLYVNKVV